ncbi:protein DMP3 [Abrus precatorius]|uniref:Protein DMP3 n=1 Tax=Abrus precatorius TaxID=3816 RepID=A0A8B8K3X8_ABRPR|nr:protein DMP3 [Abrus precatorius]
MSVRQRGTEPAPRKQSDTEENAEPRSVAVAVEGRSGLSQTLSSTANLANLLPTGTLLAFQILTPVFTNNGVCDSVTRPLSLGLLVLLGLSCFVACMTDTVKASNGEVYHGLATLKGLWLFDSPTEASSLPDLRKYKLRFIDCVHALLSVLVFSAVALRDRNVLSCFYPTPQHQTQEVLDIVPLGIGLICSLLFLVFPSTRHGIGFPVTPGK